MLKVELPNIRASTIQTLVEETDFSLSTGVYLLKLTWPGGGVVGDGESDDLLNEDEDLGLTPPPQPPLPPTRPSPPPLLIPPPLPPTMSTTFAAVC